MELVGAVLQITEDFVERVIPQEVDPTWQESSVSKHLFEQGGGYLLSALGLRTGRCVKKGHNLGLGERPAIDYPRSRISPISAKVEPEDVNKVELRRNVLFICKNTR